MMKRMYGQSMTEYGIIACLVAVVALPALVLLSDNTNDLLGNMLQGNPPSPQANARAAAPNANLAANRNAQAGTAVDQFVLNNTKAVYDARTGSFTVPVYEANGGGTTTASVNGEGREVVGAMANYLSSIASEYEKANGQPLPADIVAGLNDLSSRAFNISNTIEKAMQGIPNFDEDEVAQAGVDFTRAFEALMSKPDMQKYQDVGELASVYSGVVSKATDDEMAAIMKVHGNSVIDTRGYDNFTKIQAKAIVPLSDVPSTASMTSAQRADLVNEQGANIEGLTQYQLPSVSPAELAPEAAPEI